MKDMIISLIRHALTALAGAGTLMAGRGLIATEDAAAVNASGVTVRDALVVVAMAIVARLMMHFGGKIFGSNKVDGGGAMLLLLGAVALFGALPSCTPQQLEAAKAVPIKACYYDKDGNRACYSTANGVEVDYKSSK